MAEHTGGYDDQNETSSFEGASSGARDDQTGLVETDRGSRDAEFPDPDDLPALHADDALLDLLGGQYSADTAGRECPEDDELHELLMSWRQDIDSEPMTELVDTDTAVSAIRSASPERRPAARGRKRRTLVPVAVAAAVLAIAFTGTGLAARNAEPGDPLWGLTKVLYTDHAQSVQAAASVRMDLATADRAIEHGRYRKARQALESAQQALSQVQPDENLQQLRAEHRKLSSKLEHKSADGEGSSAAETTTAEAGDESSAPGSAVRPPAASSSPTESSGSSEPSGPSHSSDGREPTSEPTGSSPPPSSSSTPSPTSTATPTPSATTSAKDGRSGIEPKSDPSNKDGPLP